MKKTYTDNMTALWSKLEPIVYEAIKDAPGFHKRSDGTYHYEVIPIPGDCIDEVNKQKVLAAGCADEVILQAVGGKYFAAIDAAEQALSRYCWEQIKAEFSDETRSMLPILLSQIVIIHAPISYYKNQLLTSDKLV